MKSSPKVWVIADFKAIPTCRLYIGYNVIGHNEGNHNWENYGTTGGLWFHNEWVIDS